MHPPHQISALSSSGIHIKVPTQTLGSPPPITCLMELSFVLPAEGTLTFLLFLEPSRHTLTLGLLHSVCAA